MISMSGTESCQAGLFRSFWKIILLCPISTSKFSLTFWGRKCLFGLVHLSMVCLAGTLSQINQPQLLQTARPWLEDLDSCPNTSISALFLCVSQSHKKHQALCPRYLGLSLESYWFFWLGPFCHFFSSSKHFFHIKDRAQALQLSLERD